MRSKITWLLSVISITATFFTSCAPKTLPMDSDDVSAQTNPYIPSQPVTNEVGGTTSTQTDVTENEYKSKQLANKESSIITE